ncbi:MAG: thioredoxin domain-containing protein [Aureispira sp.]
MSHDQQQVPNHLIHETSPYLQQHAYNPVEWYPWGEEALKRAQEEDKPILVSIGYSTCHWCHVMERESFENEAIAAYMNQHFINIKIDREERPDLDAIYMDAVQLIQNGQGGWPLNCFLLPNKQPFFGGTYFPPQPAYQRASWPQVLENIATAYQERRTDVEEQAARLLSYMTRAQTQLQPKAADEGNSEKKAVLKDIFEQLQQNFDLEHGGFGSAPKFPGTIPLEYCLHYHLTTGNEAAKEHLLLSLDKMCRGGIYDHLGGGFARYTVDERWLVPHFEKMLYDNALLVSLLAEGYQLTRKPIYHQRIVDTLDWVQREMKAPKGGFYSALDADSEGVEGKFYVWSKAEVEQVLGARADLFCKVYDITEEGNWEGHNILNLPQSLETVVDQLTIAPNQAAELERLLRDCRAQLLEARATRIRPGLDDKILLDWNALMVKAYAKAYRALGVAAYLEEAVAVLDWLLEHFKVAGEEWALYHSYHSGGAKHAAFLDDYAFLIAALLELYQCTQASKYKKLAIAYTDFVHQQFWDYKQQLYYFTAAGQDDILFHRKAIYDGATPSGNSIMAHNLQQLAILVPKDEYRQQAAQMLALLEDNMQKYPSSFGGWATAFLASSYPMKTVAVIGKEAAHAWRVLLQQPLHNVYLEVDAASQKLADANQALQIIICENFACGLPLSTVNEALEVLNHKK